jgi:hypothetical protein
MSQLILRRIRGIAPAFVLLVALAAAAQTAQPPNHVVVVPVATMFSGPSTDTDVVSQAIYGSNVTVFEKKKKFRHVRTADDYTGWMRESDVKKLSGAPYASTGSTVEVWNLSANLYREMDVTKHAPLVIVPFESKLEVVNDKADKNGRWLEVKLPDGRQAFVQHGDVRSDAQPMEIPEIIALAKRFMGVTYTWGGSSSFGYDCSGFMQMLMRHRGRIMPRDAGPQAGWGALASVERASLQPGDLLYFGSSLQKITHTGMYIGDGQFIHDTTNAHPMVQISKLDDAPWTTLLVAARRLK